MGYVTIYEEYKHKFMQIPKVFFTSDKYTTLSNNAKIAWALLRERSSVSKKNKWFDKETGRVYFIYRNEDLMEILNLGSKTTVVKIKKELKDYGLIEEVRVGYNRPNKIYLKYPIVEDKDIEQIDEFEKYTYDCEKVEETAETLGAQGSTENGLPKIELPEVQKMDSSYTESSYTEFKRLDTRDTSDTGSPDFGNQESGQVFSDQEREKKKDAYFQTAFLNNTERVPERIAQMLNVFSRTQEQAAEYYKIILTAKKNAEKDIDRVIMLEYDPELEQKVVDTFVRSIRKIEREQTINNPKGYIYKAIYDLILFERGESVLFGSGNQSEKTTRQKEIEEYFLRENY